MAFSDAMMDAARGGKLSLIQLVLHELADWPGALMREYWGDIHRRKEAPMTEMVSSLAGGGGVPGNAPQPGSWKDTWRAGVPHLLLMSLATFSMFLENAPFMADEHGMGTFIAGTITVLFWIILLSTFGRSFWTARKEGWPGWSASWFGYLFVLVTAPVILYLQDSPFATARGWDQFYFAAVLPLILVGLLYILVRKDWIKALLVATPFAIMLWWPVLEFVPNPIRNPLNLWMLAIVAGVSMGIVWMGNWQKGIWLIMGGSLLVGLPVAYARTYHVVYPGWTSDLATPLDMANLGINTLFWSGMLIIGPVLLGVLRRVGQEIGSQGKFRYRIMIAGLFLNLTGSIFLLQSRLSYVYRGRWETTLALLILAGFILLFFGAVSLGSAAWFTNENQNRWPPILLSALSFGFPVVFLFPLLYIRRWSLPSAIPVGFFLENNVPESLPYGLGLIWLLVIGWFVSRIIPEMTKTN